MCDCFTKPHTQSPRSLHTSHPHPDYADVPEFLSCDWLYDDREGGNDPCENKIIQLPLPKEIYLKQDVCRHEDEIGCINLVDTDGDQNNILPSVKLRSSACQEMGFEFYMKFLSDGLSNQSSLTYVPVLKHFLVKNIYQVYFVKLLAQDPRLYPPYCKYHYHYSGFKLEIFFS